MQRAHYVKYVALSGGALYIACSGAGTWSISTPGLVSCDDFGMKLKLITGALLLVLGVPACGPPAYYVANVYQSGAGLVMQKCALDGGRHGDKPDPENCKFEQVGPLPSDAQVPGAPPAPAPAPPVAAQ